MTEAEKLAQEETELKVNDSSFETQQEIPQIPDDVVLRCAKKGQPFGCCCVDRLTKTHLTKTRELVRVGHLVSRI